MQAAIPPLRTLAPVREQADPTAKAERAPARGPDAPDLPYLDKQDQAEDQRAALKSGPRQEAHLAKVKTRSDLSATFVATPPVILARHEDDPKPADEPTSAELNAALQSATGRPRLPDQEAEPQDPPIRLAEGGPVATDVPVQGDGFSPQPQPAGGVSEQTPGRSSSGEASTAELGPTAFALRFPNEDRGSVAAELTRAVAEQAAVLRRLDASGAQGPESARHRAQAAQELQARFLHAALTTTSDAEVLALATTEGLESLGLGEIAASAFGFRQAAEDLARESVRRSNGDVWSGAEAVARLRRLASENAVPPADVAFLIDWMISAKSVASLDCTTMPAAERERIFYNLGLNTSLVSGRFIEKAEPGAFDFSPDGFAASNNLRAIAALTDTLRLFVENDMTAAEREAFRAGVREWKGRKTYETLIGGAGVGALGAATVASAIRAAVTHARPLEALMDGALLQAQARQYLRSLSSTTFSGVPIPKIPAYKLKPKTEAELLGRGGGRLSESEIVGHDGMIYVRQQDGLFKRDYASGDARLPSLAELDRSGARVAPVTRNRIEGQEFLASLAREAGLPVNRRRSVVTVRGRRGVTYLDIKVDKGEALGGRFEGAAVEATLNRRLMSKWTQIEKEMQAAKDEGVPFYLVIGPEQKVSEGLRKRIEAAAAELRVRAQIFRFDPKTLEFSDG